MRDQYFVKTSLAGTHTCVCAVMTAHKEREERADARILLTDAGPLRSFFMLFLPLWYWFGHPEVGKGCASRFSDRRLSAS